MFSSEQWLANSGSNFYNGVATQSLRFDDGSSPKLTHTSSSNGNRKTFTISFWIKRANISIDQMRILNSNFGSDGIFDLYFEDTDEIVFRSRATNTNGATFEWARKSQRKFRDVSAWYHIAIAVDVTVSSPSSPLDLFTFYLNGENITSNFTNTTNPERSVGTSNVDLYWNSTTEHEIGSSGYAGQYFDGYLAEFCNIDGLALAETNFGEFKNGVWIPIEPVVSDYGTNGFRLKFDKTGTGTASTSTIGADSSSNNNHFTTSTNILASDCAMPDSPENNFATINPNDGGAQAKTGLGNLGVDFTGNSGNSIRSSFMVSSGKWYCEMRRSSYQCTVGIISDSAPANTNGSSYWVGSTALGSGGSYAYTIDGTKRTNGSNDAYGDAYSTGDIVGIALDMDNGTLAFYKNGVVQNSGTPAFTGISGTYAIGIGFYGGAYGSVWHVFNFGQNPTFAGHQSGAITAGTETDANGYGLFKYAPPSGGYLALCSANLPEPTIGANSDTQADDHFNTVLYTGNNTNNHAITGVGFQPDLVWLKNRNGGWDHLLTNSSVGAGANKGMSSNTTNNETAVRTDLYGFLGSFDSDGFTLNEGTSSPNEDQWVNGTGLTYVSWNWKANGGTTSSNTDGSITSTVQANTDAGFSIVTWTGTGATVTLGHGLGKKPDVMIVKNRDDAESWVVYHSANTSAPATDYLLLNSTSATADNNTLWNDTEPTDSVFTVYGQNAMNGSSDGMLAYLFTEVEGYSKFGSYTGNNSTDGSFVFLNFSPAFVMIKSTVQTESWDMHDNARNTFNVNDKSLLANTVSTENAVGVARQQLDFLSNGFKLRNQGDANPSINNEATTYIYMAFAESPFKYANAR